MYAYAYMSAYYSYSINIMYIMYLKLRPTAFLFLCYYLNVARDALHANTLGLSEPRVDARCVCACVYVCVCACVCLSLDVVRLHLEKRYNVHVPMASVQHCCKIAQIIVGRNFTIDASLKVSFALS